MTGRGLGLVLGLTGMIVSGSAGAQTASSSSSAAIYGSPKPKPAVTAAPRPVTTVKPATASTAAKPATTAAPACNKPVSASSTAVAAKTATPKPVAIPPQPTSVPAECLSFDTAPFGDLQGLDITGPTHAPVHFEVEVASEPAQRGQGLMCRMKLPAIQGMLFEFPKAGEQIFWMHDTVLPLDILYIAPDGHIVSISKVARPLNDRKLPSHGAANGVLEINAGLADKLGLKAGDMVVFPFFAPAPVAPETASVSASASASPNPAQ